MSAPKGIPEAIVSVIITYLHLMYWYLEVIFRVIVPPSMKSIDGETILVTGAVGGIGREMCKHIIRSGRDIKLVLWDLNEKSLEKFARELTAVGKGKGIKVFHFAVDISSKDNINQCCQKVKDTVGPVTILFNNAGILQTGNFLLMKDEQIESTMQVNLMSHFWIIRQFLPDMVSRNHGRIVNTCSIAGFIAAPHSFPYFASKFAVNGYSEALRQELEMSQCDGIHVTAIYPWFVQTPLIKSLGVNRNAGIGLHSVLPGFLEPEFVGRSAVDGMRREYEHVYLPRMLQFYIALQEFVPKKFRSMVQATLQEYYAYGDAKEQKEFLTSFSSVVQNRNGQGQGSSKRS